MIDLEVLKLVKSKSGNNVYLIVAPDTARHPYVVINNSSDISMRHSNAGKCSVIKHYRTYLVSLYATTRETALSIANKLSDELNLLRCVLASEYFDSYIKSGGVRSSSADNKIFHAYFDMDLEYYTEKEIE